MIRTDRSLVDGPSDLDRPAAEALETLWRFYRQGESYRSQRRYPFDERIWTADTVHAALWELFHRKCAFCECRFKSHQELEVAHLRPRQKATGIRKGAVCSDHYWWLAYRWDNLYPVCRLCHRYKAHSFPVEKARPEVRGREQLELSPLLDELEKGLRAERPLLLDPCRENPEALLDYDYLGKIRGKNLRAKVTIEVLGLNRPELVARRRKVFAELDRATERWQEELSSSNGTEREEKLTLLFNRLAGWCAAAGELAGLKRKLARRALARLKLRPSDTPPELDLPELRTPVPRTARRLNKAGRRRLKEREDRVLTKLRSIWITSIELENFRGIHQLEIGFPPAQSGRDPWLMLIGTNGVGKSSILQAIALALSTPSRRRKLVPDASTCMNHCTSDSWGHVRVRFNTGDEVQLRFGKNSPRFRQQGLTKELKSLKILGFGSTRLPPPCWKQPPKRQFGLFVDNLFNPHRPLADPEWWLANPSVLPTRQFNRFKPTLRDLLCLGDEVGLSRHRGKLYLEQFEGRHSLRESSDGYQTVVTLATEILSKLSASNRCVEDVEGTVLLDEIEVHLHPTWKVRIVSTLRKIFPHVRFIVTTHDPLCLRGLEEGEICLMDRDQNGRVRSRALTIPAGLRADQLLTGEWFGMSSTLDDETLGLIEEHGRLLIKSPKSSSETRRQHRIEAELRLRLGGFAETSVDRIALGVAAQHMANKEPRKQTPERRKRLRDKIEERLALVGV